MRGLPHAKPQHNPRRNRKKQREPKRILVVTDNSFPARFRQPPDRPLFGDMTLPIDWPEIAAGGGPAHRSERNVLQFLNALGVTRLRRVGRRVYVERHDAWTDIALDFATIGAMHRAANHYGLMCDRYWFEETLHLLALNRMQPLK